MGRQTDATNAVQTTIDKARAASHGAGTHEELDKLAADLRSHLARMLPAARAHVDQLWHGSPEWYVLATRLNSIATEAQQPLGPTTLAAHVQIRILALDCEWLLTRHGTQLPAQLPAEEPTQ